MEIILGLILLLVGGDALVRGSVTVARKLRVSELMIGLTLVGFGTSTPELVTSLKAAFADAPGISIGNVVGSNIANILLILGITSLIYPIKCEKQAIKRDGIAVIASALCCVAIVLYGTLNPLTGIVFVLLIASYLVYTYLKEKNTTSPSEKMHEAEAQLVQPDSGKLLLGAVMALGGIAITILGAKFLVDGSIKLARNFGISETVIGLTIVAVGTSLPEMVTSVIAALRKNSDIALGNIIGSNIFNIWFILGVTAIIKPIPVPSQIAMVDIWVMLAASIIFISFAYFTNGLKRYVGGLFLICYIFYLITLM